MNEQNSDVNGHSANNKPKDSSSPPSYRDVEINRELNTSEAGDEGRKPDDVKKGGAFWRWIREESSLTDWLIALFTIVLAGVSILQWLVLSGQLREMQSGSVDTHALALAAQKQMNAAAKFATSADSINTEIKAAVQDFQRMATASESSILASRDALRLDQRAWVAPIEVAGSQPFGSKPNPAFVVGRTIELSIIIINSGKSPALNLAGKTDIRTLPRDTKFSPLYRPTKLMRGRSVLVPGAKVAMIAPPSDQALTQQLLDDLHRGDQVLYLYGTYTYRDVFKETPTHVTTFCMYLPLDFGGLSSCDTYNYAD